MVQGTPTGQILDLMTAAVTHHFSITVQEAHLIQIVVVISQVVAAAEAVAT